MLNYSISLINLWFAGNGIDTRYFESIEAQRAYFAPLCQPVEHKNINFNMGDNVSTVINYTDTSDRPIEEIVGSNYAVVRRYSDDGTTIESERYYFAVVRQLSGRNLEVSLRLDSIQTHYFKYKSNISECHINRACLNRFEEKAGNTTQVSFIGDITSPFFNSENIDLPKRMMTKVPIKANPDLGNSGLSDYIANINATTWIYILMANNEKLPEGAFSIAFNYEGLTLPYVVLCAPLTGHYYVGTDGGTTSKGNWTLDGLLSYIKFKELTPYIYTVKVSSISPFIEDVYTTDDFYRYSVDNQNVLGIKLQGLVVSKGNVQFYDPPEYAGMYLASLMGRNCVDLRSLPINLSAFTSVDINFVFNKSDIIGANKDPKFNPKYLSSACFNARVSDIMGNSFDYDLQKVNYSTIIFSMDEPVLPDNTRGYVRILTGDTKNSYYNNDNNYVGLVVNNDTSLLYEQTAIETFNANNKNFSQIQQAQRDYNTEMYNIGGVQRSVNMLLNMGQSTTAGILQGTIGGDPVKGISTLIGGLFEMPRALSDIYFAGEQLNAKNNLSKLNETLTLDNIRCSPASLKNAQGSIIFNSETAGNAASLSANYFLEIWKAYDADIERFNDIIVEYGFSYERIGHVSDFDNIRKYFNYIAAEIETIDAPISIQEKNDIRDRFKSIRFWNVDTVDFTLENYEKWLEGDTNG